MKSKLLSVILCVIIVGPAPVRAASEDECAIWLCLPVGFVFPECNSARIAMYERLFEFKGPVPSFGSCEAPNSTNPNSYTFAGGSAIKMSGANLGPQKIIDGGFCNHRDSGRETPLGCSKTLKMYRLFENGVQMGMTFYRDSEPGGLDYVRDPVTQNVISLRNFIERNTPVIE